MVNLAVIGTGIGGCSAAYFAHKHIPNSKITVYETENRVGGRIFTFNGEQTKTELGATFFHPINRTVCNLTKEMNLPVKKLEESMDLAVWNGTDVIFKSSQHTFYTMLKLLTKYKLSVPKLLLSLRETNEQIKKWYKKDAPTDFSELFESVGLDKWYKMPFDQILDEIGIDQRFIDELVTPITRIIYSQNAELGGFAGITALLGVYGTSMYSIKDGNDVLPKKLLESSNAKIRLETKVESLEKTSKDSFQVSAGNDSSVFDGVIIAAPLEMSNIVFDGIPNQKEQSREYQRIYIRLMKGTINSSYFNLEPSNKLPSIILTSKEADPITRFSIKQSPKGGALVEVTSTEPIGEDLVDDLFKDGKTVLDHTWNAAYPVFKPIQKIPSTRLDKGLFYLNAIESATSTMESSAFAALNSIKTLKQQIMCGKP